MKLYYQVHLSIQHDFTNDIYANNKKTIIGTTDTALSYTKLLINSTDGTSQQEFRGTSLGATGSLLLGLGHTYGDGYVQL